MDNISDKINKINKIYNKINYFDIYGLDIFISIILILIFFIAISYFNIINNLQLIKANWINERCKPNIIPFAGLINKPKNETIFNYTNKNFIQCANAILKGITVHAFKPSYYLMKLINLIFKILSESINYIREIFNKIRNSITLVIKDIMGRALNIITPILQIIITAKSIASKTIGTFTAFIYTLLGGYFQIQSFILFFMDLIQNILLTLVKVIAGLWITSFFFPPAAIAAATTSAIMILILIPVLLLKILFADVLDLSIANPPRVPKKRSCFSENTLIKLNNNTYKKISEINLNDILFDGSKVTAKIKASSYGQEIYNIDNIIVTGNHSIFHNIKGWITVKEHPDSILINDFKDPYVYCINTNTKTIKINNNTFSDWDDIDDNDIIQLKNNFSLPPNFNNNDIHKYFDGGFHPNMKIKLKNNNFVKIKDIKINDILSNDERVCGLVVLNKKDIYDYNINLNNILTCSKNINIIDNNINTNNLKGLKNEENITKLYHLVTDKKSFVINSIRVGDYNTGIENFLSM